MPLYLYITFVVPLSVLIPIVYAFINYKYLNRALKILLGFIVFSAVMDAIDLVMARGYHLNTLAIFHIYTPFEFAFLSFFFAEFYDKRGKIVIYLITGAFIIFCLYNTFFIQNTMKMNSYARSIEAVILIAYCMLFFSKNNNDIEYKWSHHNTNWIVAGILLYYAGALFMFIFFNVVTKPGVMTNIIWGAHNTILITEYILFAVGFYKCRPQQTIFTSR